MTQSIFLFLLIIPSSLVRGAERSTLPPLEGTESCAPSSLEGGEVSLLLPGATKLPCRKKRKSLKKDELPSVDTRSSFRYILSDQLVILPVEESEIKAYKSLGE